MAKTITVIGGGPGGYVAAIRGAQLGADVTLIENHKIGGTCLNYGCIPTKAFYKSAEVLENLSIADQFGLDVADFNLNVEKLQKHKNGVVEELTSGIEKILIANGVTIIKGTASFESDKTVSVKKDDKQVIEIESDYFILATGSKVFVPQIEGIDSKRLVTSKELLDFDRLPEKLVVLGGGVVAMEFASIFNAFGSDVTVVARSSVLKGFDKDVVKRVSAYLKKKGIKILTNTNLLKLSDEDTYTGVHISGKKGESVLNADLVLSAMGRKPNTEGLSLDKAGIEITGSAIAVDDHYKTSNSRVYAIGDVNGKYMLAHAASHQGVHVAEGIMALETMPGGQEGSVGTDKMNIVPSCVFISPEMASVGVNEDEATEKGLEIKVSKFPFSANGKAMTMNHTEGFVKLTALSDGQLIGAQIVGAHASDLIHELTIAIAHGLKDTDVTTTIHAHPTLSESVSEAAYGLLDGALHMAPVKRRKDKK